MIHACCLNDFNCALCDYGREEEQFCDIIECLLEGGGFKLGFERSTGLQKLAMGWGESDFPGNRKSMGVTVAVGYTLHRPDHSALSKHRTYYSHITVSPR